MSRLYSASFNRRKELRRKTRLSSKTPMKKRNAKRAAKRRREVFGDRADYVATLPCCACHHPGPSDPHHVRSRGAGGGAVANLVPLCRTCHTELHTLGAQTFEKLWGVDLAAKAERYEEWFTSDQPEGF